jgi:hypothetical protein
MIEAKFGLVSGLEQEISIDKEWNVETENGTIIFSNELGPLIVATVIANFNRTTIKSDLKNLTSLSYLSLTSETSEHQFEDLEKPPREYTKKELGDVFDAFVRRRNFPLRENVYHIGKLSFRRLLFVQYPSDYDLVEKIISDIDISPDLDEDYVKESYFRTFHDKYNRLHRGTNNETRKTRASVETISRLNEKLVEVQTIATTLNAKKNVSIDIKIDERAGEVQKPKTKKSIKKVAPVATGGINKYDHGSEYSGVVLEYIDNLNNGEIS